jgi:hypothetical protein
VTRVSVIAPTLVWPDYIVFMEFVASWKENVFDVNYWNVVQFPVHHARQLIGTQLLSYFLTASTRPCRTHESYPEANVAAPRGYTSYNNISRNVLDSFQDCRLLPQSNNLAWGLHLNTHSATTFLAITRCHEQQPWNQPNHSAKCCCERCIQFKAVHRVHENDGVYVNPHVNRGPHLCWCTGRP